MRLSIRVCASSSLETTALSTGDSPEVALKTTRTCSSVNGFESLALGVVFCGWSCSRERYDPCKRSIISRDSSTAFSLVNKAFLESEARLLPGVLTTARLMELLMPYGLLCGVKSWQLI